LIRINPLRCNISFSRGS